MLPKSAASALLRESAVIHGIFVTDILLFCTEMSAKLLSHSNALARHTKFQINTVSAKEVVIYSNKGVSIFTYKTITHTC